MGNSAVTSSRIEYENTPTPQDPQFKPTHQNYLERKYIALNDKMMTINNYGEEYVVEKNTGILTIIGIGTRVKVRENDGLIIIKTHEGQISISNNLGDIRIESGTRTKVDVQANFIYEAVVDKALGTKFNKDLAMINTQNLTPLDGRYIVRLGNLPPVYVKEGQPVPVSGIVAEEDIKYACCSICMNDFENNHQDACYLACEHSIRHWFHFSCVKIWMTKQSNSCPNCKRPVMHICRIADPTMQPVSVPVPQTTPVNPLSCGFPGRPNSNPAQPSQPLGDLSVVPMDPSHHLHTLQQQPGTRAGDASWQNGQNQNGPEQRNAPITPEQMTNQQYRPPTTAPQQQGNYVVEVGSLPNSQFSDRGFYSPDFSNRNHQNS